MSTSLIKLTTVSPSGNCLLYSKPYLRLWYNFILYCAYCFPFEYFFLPLFLLLQIVGTSSSSLYRPLLHACAGYLSSFSPTHVSYICAFSSYLLIFNTTSNLFYFILDHAHFGVRCPLVFDSELTSSASVCLIKLFYRLRLHVSSLICAQVCWHPGWLKWLQRFYKLCYHSLELYWLLANWFCCYLWISFKSLGCLWSDGLNCGAFGGPFSCNPGMWHFCALIH